MKRIGPTVERKKLKKEAVNEANLFDSRRFCSIGIIGKNTTAGVLKDKLFVRLVPAVQNVVYSQDATNFSKASESAKYDDYYKFLLLTSVAELAENDIVLVMLLDVNIDTLKNYFSTNAYDITSAVSKLTKTTMRTGFAIKTATTSHKDQSACIIIGKLNGSSIAAL